MKIQGLKGCYEKTRGLFYFARMCSKVRLHATGRLPEDYHGMLGQGFDGRTCRYLSVRYDDVRAQVLGGKSDEEVLDWCLANGRRLTDEEVLIYNSFMSKRGWRAESPLLRDSPFDGRKENAAYGAALPSGLRKDGRVVLFMNLYPDFRRPKSLKTGALWAGKYLPGFQAC